MAMSSVLDFGQWGYPIQDLGSYGRAEEKKSSSMLFTSEQCLSRQCTVIKAAVLCSTCMHYAVQFDGWATV